MSGSLEETRAFWNRVADDWKRQVGVEGDANRRLNSDPVLWDLAGNVRGRTVLDAGCGTGYLSAKLKDAGGRVIGVDFSPRMIEIARDADPDVDFRVDSCSSLDSIPDSSIDLVVSNYVLMDTPELEETIAAFHRVLRDGGAAVLIFSHPCFPAGQVAEAEGRLTYWWDTPYFERHRVVEPPWGHFTSDFIWFHRSLSDYWRAFTEAGFKVTDFEEPRLSEDRAHLADSPRERHKSRTRPYSVAFRLVKPAT